MRFPLNASCGKTRYAIVNKSVSTDQNVDGYRADQNEENHFEVLGICLT